MSKWFGRNVNKEANKSESNSSASQCRVAIGDQIDDLIVKGDFKDKVQVNFQDDGKTKFDVGDKFKKLKAGTYHKDKKYEHT